MKTLTALTLTTVLTLGITAPAQANTNNLTENLTNIVSLQLTELSANIKQQAQSALERTVAELFFADGAEQAQQNLDKVTADVSAQQANTAKE
uniref:Orphan protein n=1 Tax=Rheinheimera sp. BAL341 TaxID=1708203 RepID=A0A486XUF6_9GAMM